MTGGDKMKHYSLTPFALNAGEAFRLGISILFWKLNPISEFVPQYTHFYKSWMWFLCCAITIPETPK